MAKDGSSEKKKVFKTDQFKAESGVNMRGHWSSSPGLKALK